MEINYLKSEKARKLILQGHTCSESVMLAFCSEFNLSKDLASRIATGFSGGMGLYKTCGAVCAAVMVIGLKYGEGDTFNKEKRKNCLDLTKKFFKRFEEIRKTTECRKILLNNNINPDDPKDMENLRSKNLCHKVVFDAVKILEDILTEAENGINKKVRA